MPTLADADDGALHRTLQWQKQWKKIRRKKILPTAFASKYPGNTHLGLETEEVNKSQSVCREYFSLAGCTFDLLLLSPHPHLQFPESSWGFLLWKYSNLSGCLPVWPIVGYLLRQGVGFDDPLKSLLTPAILWFPNFFAMTLGISVNEKNMFFTTVQISKQKSQRVFNTFNSIFLG